METLKKLLDAIRQRPGMYVQRCPLQLNSFIQGWHLGKGTVCDMGYLRAFEKWLARKHGITSSHSWADIILFYSEGNVEAFENFWELWDEFHEKLGRGEIDDEILEDGWRD